MRYVQGSVQPAEAISEENLLFLEVGATPVTQGLTCLNSLVNAPRVSDLGCGVFRRGGRWIAHTLTRASMGRAGAFAGTRRSSH